MELHCLLGTLMKNVCIILICAGVIVQPFVLDNQASCFPDYRCTCSSDSDILCDHANLTDIPLIPQTNDNHSVHNFDLGFNDITAIPADAFVNISSLTDLRLDGNKISLIDDDAFSGIESSLYLLSLRNNRLTKLSDAFLRLPGLSVLTLEGNPISSLDPIHLSTLGRTLRIFTISLTYFQSWPTQLHYLMNLMHLRIADIPFTYLPLDAFSGFETSLSGLEISNSTFRRIPSAICHLTNLDDFIYENNRLTQHPVLEPCRTPLGRVNSVRFRDNNFDRYPDILHTFPNILHFVVDGNPSLVYIASQIVNDSVGAITDLDVSSNGFERVPSALRFYANVDSLNMSFNFIKTIEYGDLGGLRKLRYLYLQGNPLVFIDSLAFTPPSGGVLPISEINLQLTSLGHIPEATAGLPSLARVRISGKPIECSCAMKYLKHWTNITVEGGCEFSAEPLQNYISGDLQRCY